MKDVLKRVREYTQNNHDLMKCHHYMFNLPLSQKQKADVIIIGLNPGESADDWKYDGPLPTEETSEFDFHNHSKVRSRSNIVWTKKCKDFFPDSSIYQTEFFFWSSSDLDNKFEERFGYEFYDNPHFDFCRKCNEEMFRYHKPKIICATGIGNHKLLADLYDLEHVETFKSKLDKRKRNVIIHYEFEDIPFIFTPHWTSGFVSKLEKSEIKTFLKKIISDE
jgi:hypothetical protein